MPGDHIKAKMDAHGMTQARLAMLMGRPAEQISRLIRGRIAVTAETAMQLELVFGVPAETWWNLEGEYRIAQLRAKTRLLRV